MPARSSRAGKGTAAEKMAALTAAGVRVVKSPADIGRAVADALKWRPRLLILDGMWDGAFDCSVLRPYSMSAPLPAAELEADQSAVPVVNDFSIQVATVNGSGSQTANLVLLRSIFQMGMPVSGKNLFPSNIAGLPTWYTIRANHRGYVARKKEIDFLVAMNPETAQRRRAVARAGPRGRLRRAAEARRAAHRPDLLSGAVRQDRRRGLPGRQAPPARQEHDLRRHPVGAAVDRARRDGEGAHDAARQEAEGDAAEHGRARGRQEIRGRASDEARSRTASSG